MNKDWKAAAEIHFHYADVKHVDFGVSGKVNDQVNAKLKTHLKKKEVEAALKWKYQIFNWTFGGKYNLKN